MLENPQMQQMMQSAMSNPAMMEMAMRSNPQMRAMIEANPQMAQMMQNPQLLQVCVLRVILRVVPTCAPNNPKPQQFLATVHGELLSTQPQTANNSLSAVHDEPCNAARCRAAGLKRLPHTVGCFSCATADGRHGRQSDASFWRQSHGCDGPVRGAAADDAAGCSLGSHTAESGAAGV